MDNEITLQMVYEKLEELNRYAAIQAKEVLTIDEAASFLGVTRSSLYNKVHKRFVPYYKAGARVMFRKSELMDWALSERVPTMAEEMTSVFLGRPSGKQTRKGQG